MRSTEGILAMMRSPRTLWHTRSPSSTQRSTEEWSNNAYGNDKQRCGDAARRCRAFAFVLGGVVPFSLFGERAAWAQEPAALELAALDEAPDDGSLFEAPPRPLRKLGLMFDLGTMDGAMMSLVYRPLPWIRVHGGGGTNGVSPGLRVGAVATPFHDSGWSFSLEGGHFFPGNVNGLFAIFAGSDYDDSHLLERFDYDYVNLQVGWDVERGDLLFFARGGVGLLWTQLPSDNLGRISNLSSMVDPDGSVEAFLPSLKIGIIGFL
jgi:hypothetical protein